LRKAGLVEMRRTDRGYLVEVVEGEVARETAAEQAPEAAGAEAESAAAPAQAVPAETAVTSAEENVPPAAVPSAPVLAATPASQEDSLAALRQSLPGHFEKNPNRPLYLRQIRQLLRGAGVAIDERAGFRGLLDILHQAQREGWLRLHRDRKGVWRIFPASPAPVAAAASPAGAEVAVEAPPGMGPELESELLPVETDVNWEVEVLPEETTELEEAPPAPVLEEDAAKESAPAPKARKARAPKAGAKTAKRKAAPRRKHKEAAPPAGE